MKRHVSKIVGPERKGPYVTFCQIEKIGFKVQNSRKNQFLHKKLLPIKVDFFRFRLCSVNVESFIKRFLSHKGAIHKRRPQKKW